MNTLPELCKDMSEEHILAAFVPSSERKIKLTMSHLIRMKEKEPGLSASDFVEFVTKAQVTGADPIKEQIYLIPRNKKVNGQWKKFGTVVFSYHFFIARAEASKHYNGYETEDGCGEYMDPDTGKVKKQPYVIARAYRKDLERPIAYKAWFCEFAQRDRDENLTAQWKAKPMLMLTKCALSNALKQAFPNDLAGIDIGETISITKTVKVDEPESIPTTATVVEESKVAAEKETSGPEKPESALDIDNYVVPFGKFQGQKIKAVPLYDLNQYKKFVESESKKKGTMSAVVQLFLQVADTVIKGE